MNPAEFGIDSKDLKRLQKWPSIKAWKSNAEHLEAQKNGRQRWYSAYQTRIALVERDYGN